MLLAGLHAATGFSLLDYEALLPSCLFHELTALPCPGCGMTRALIHLTQLHLQLALESNPLVLLLLTWSLAGLLQKGLGLRPLSHHSLESLAFASAIIMALTYLNRLFPAFLFPAL